MFTGIIQAVGYIAQRDSTGIDARLSIKTQRLVLHTVQQGDSIAVSGVCLTVVTLQNDGFWADVSGETLKRTTLGELRVGSEVNLEKALTLQTPLGGHIVSGHVDGIGEITQRSEEGRSVRFQIRVPPELARYIASKGSICIEGVSLTVNTVIGAEFTVNLVPHTLTMTTLKQVQVGQRVNLEVDIIARYLERLLLGEKAAYSHVEEEDRMSLEFLQRHGFA